MTRASSAFAEDRDARRYPSPERSSSPYLYFSLLIGVLLLFGVVRFRLRDMPLERDEGEYAYAGQLLLHHLPPYEHLYSVKLPGTYAAYAAILRMFGQSAAGVHIGLLLANGATVLLLFLVARRLFGRLAAFVAASTFALFSAGASVNGLAGHATHFVVLFAVAGIWMLVCALEAESLMQVLYAGLLFGLAFLMKQPGAVFIAWAAVYLLRSGRAASIEWSYLLKQFFVLLAGAALPYAAICVGMAATGEFHNFWFWTFSYVRNYGSAVPMTDGLRLLYLSASDIVESALGIWLIALVGLTVFLCDAWARRHSFFILSLLLFSFAGTSAGLYFRPHYFILVLPAVSVLVGIAVGSATERLSTVDVPLLKALPTILFVIAFASSIYLQRQLFFQITPVEAAVQIYPRNPFVEVVEVSKYIRAHTREGDTVAVLGSEPEIFFYSHRLSATGYVYMYPLLEPRGYTIPMQQQMIQEIERSRPAMLVLMNVPASWIAYANIGSMDGILNWARKYIASNYVQDGLVEIGQETTYLWGEQARGREPATKLSILVFRRK